MNYYRRFISNCATILKPLTDALRGHVRTFRLSTEVMRAFEYVKRVLDEKMMLVRRKSEAPPAVKADASNIAVGAVLQQLVNSTWEPLSYHLIANYVAERLHRQLTET